MPSQDKPNTTHAQLIAKHGDRQPLRPGPWTLLTECRATMGSPNDDISAVVNIIATSEEGVTAVFIGNEPPQGDQLVEWLTIDATPTEMRVVRTEAINKRLWQVDLRAAGAGAATASAIPA